MGLQTFQYNNHPLRVTHQDDQGFWFVAKDVCEHLDIVNPTRALSRLDDDEKGLHTVKTLGGPQEVSVVSEPGLYSLTLTSRKAEAKAFKRWVTHEVLPSLREKGHYQIEKKPLSPLEGIAQQAQMLAALALEAEGVRKTAEEAKAIAQQTQADVLALKAAHSQAEATVASLPIPSEDPNNRTMRSNVNELLRAASIRMHIPFKDIWSKAYTEFKYRYSFDAKTRARNLSRRTGKRATPLDIIESEGHMGDFYALCHKLYGAPAAVPRLPN